MSTRIFFFLCILSVTIASCVNRIDDDSTSDESKQITFGASLQAESDVLTRSVSSSVSRIDVWDYVDGVEKQRITQLSTEEGFGTIPMNLSYGTHKLLFVAHNSEGAEYDGEWLVPSGKVTDTFIKVFNIQVNEETGSTQRISLSRQVSKIAVKITDVLPSNLQSITLEVSKYSAKINPETGIGSTPVSVQRTFEVAGTSVIGSKNVTFSLFSFVAGESHITDLNVTATGTGGETIAQETVADIQVKKNTQSVASGSLFTFNGNMEISTEEEWSGTDSYPI